MPNAALKQAENATELSQQLQLQWWLGNWQAIVDLTEDKQTLDETVVKEDIYRAAALYQLGKTQDAKSLLNGITLTADSKGELAELLISGVYNCLAKASSCISGNNRVDELFSNAIQVTGASTAISQLVSARKAEQLAQLGLPVLWPKQVEADFQFHTGEMLQELLTFDTDNPYIHLALAEWSITRANFQQAITHWQAVVAGFGSSIPQMYYDRLKFAYDKAGRYPLASDEEEMLKGDKDKHELLREIHLSLKPSLYLEIGVESGKSLSFAKCRAFGIDPMPRVSHKLGEETKLIASTSDEFFANQASTCLKTGVEFAFIDGMHLFEFALRDFINVEKFSSGQALIVIDDIFPGHAAQADRNRRTRAWTGDVWKLHKILTRFRPDLFIATLDIYPTGLMLIAGLDSSNRVLEEGYDEAVAWLKQEAAVPESYVTRANAWSGKDIRISKLITTITKAKTAGLSTKNLVDSLNEVTLVAKAR